MIKSISLDRRNRKVIKNPLGFTIVELLIVIVIIGILAAITIVSYRGITAKANESAIKADLANAKKQFEVYKVDHGSYPTGLDNTTKCLTGTTNPSPDTKYCLKSSNNGTYALTDADGNKYILTLEQSALIYKITESTGPEAVIAPVIIPITAIASISGTAQMGQTLTAGAITPAGATVSYQWQSATTTNGTYANIIGATSDTYALTLANAGKYLKVIATGTGAYSGTQTSIASSQIATDSNWKVMGTQVWATTNLNVGTRVAGIANQTNNGVLEKYCYNDAESNCTTNGGFYQWDEAMSYSTTEGAQGICPADSHVPSDNDWKILEIQLGMTQVQADTQEAWRGTDQGAQLKTGGASGLNVPLAGIRGTTGDFSYSGLAGDLWSSTESGPYAWERGLYSSYDTLLKSTGRYAYSKALGFSVRCVGN